MIFTISSQYKRKKHATIRVPVNMLTKQCLAVILTAFLSHVHSAKVLGVFTVASFSHQIVFQPIWKELSLRGHEVTVLTPNPLRDPTLTNLTEIDLSFQYENMEQFKQAVSKGTDHWAMMDVVMDVFVNLTRKLFLSDAVLKFARDNTTTFDVVLAEAVDPTTYAFAAKFKCPLIGISSLSVMNTMHEVHGTPVHPILHPDLTTPYYGAELGFFDKVDIVLFDLYQRYIYHHRYIPAVNSIIKESFGDHFPDTISLQKETSLLFLNTNPIIHGSRPYGPNVIEFGGGISLKPKKPLPSVRKPN